MPKNPAYHFKEAGPLSQWLFSVLTEASLPVICVETRHMKAVLKAQINKTDRNDARGMAQMMRVGLYRPVHVKILRSQRLRMLLSSKAAAEQLIEVIACGRPATEMPHFDKYAYEDKACYGLSARELGKDVPPDPHSTPLTKREIEAVVDYILATLRQVAFTENRCRPTRSLVG